MDTLDRQGLKFLKETLRASKLFAINTQELVASHGYNEVEESGSVEVVVASEKKTEVKKIEPVKNIHVKKVAKHEVKKPGTSQKAVRNSEKGDLGDKINKKLESLNIKTGKKMEQKPVKTPKEIVAKTKKVENVGSAGEIAEEIEVI